MGTAQHLVAAWAPASPLPQSCPLQHPRMPGGCPRALLAQQALCPTTQKEILSKKVRGPGIHLTQGQEKHANPCLAGSQAAPVLIPIHGTFQVLCASSLGGAGQECRILGAKGSFLWFWGRKSTLQEQSKALGPPSCCPYGVQVPQSGWAGALSKSWPCMWQWSVMTVDTALSTHKCQGNLPHPTPISLIP